jgi:small-conductance mechanosensitive channel
MGMARGLFHRSLPQFVLALLLLQAIPGAVAAQTSNPPATNYDNNAAGGGRNEFYPLRLANRTIFEFHATLDGYSPEERRAAAAVRLESILANAKTILVTTQALSGGIQILLDEKPLFVVARDDVLTIQGETLDSAAEKAVRELRQAIYEKSTLTSKEQVFKAAGLAAALTAAFAIVGWLTRRIAAWLQLRLTKLAAAKTEKVKSRELRRVGLKSFVSLLRTLLNMCSWLFIAFLTYTWVIQVMRCFPYLRPWGEYLHLHITEAELSFARGLLNALPGLVIVVVIILAARMLSHIVKNLFSAVEEGEVESTWFDIHTASTTRRIVVFIIWVAAVVVAYPYIPGSDSLAFKGITVFVGLVFSLGSTNIVSQVAGGLVLIYSRAFRTGDYVRFGDIEGTVIRIGLTSTYIRTIKNEEMHIANNVLAGGAIKNYSRLADEEGLFLPAKVTIPYSTPWRQVETLLLEAARRTPGLLPEPKPFVLQTALSDFYAEYELNARLTVPAERVFVLAKLHANIQDVFNEQGVTILSPHNLTVTYRPEQSPRDT